MKDFWLMFGVLVLWITLNRWVLPWFGVATCMSGGCETNRCSTTDSGQWTPVDKDAVQTKGIEQ